MIPAEVGLAYCNKLFFLEKQFRDLTPEERKDRRQETEMPVWESFYVSIPGDSEPPFRRHSTAVPF